MLGIVTTFFIAAILAIALTSRTLGRFVASNAAFNQGSWLLQLPASLAALAAVPLTLLAIRRLSGRTLAEMGLRRLTGRDLLVVAFAVISVFALSALDDSVLAALGIHHHKQSGFEHFRADTWVDLVADVVGICVVAPYAEELFFRGLLFNAFARWFGTVLAVIVSSAIFGALHGDPIYFVMLAVSGALNCVVYRVTGNLYAPMLVHGLNNAAVTLASFSGW